VSIKGLLHSKGFHALLGLAISVILIAWILYAVSWQEVGAALKGLNYLAFIPAGFLFILHYALRALRWKYLLPVDFPQPVRSLFDAIMVGAFATYILPLRAGEFVRPYMLSRQSELSFSSCFVSVIVERFFDLSMVLITFAIIVPFVDNIPDWAYTGAWSLGVLAVLILMFMLVGSFFPRQLLKLLAFCLQKFPEKSRIFLMKFADDLLAGTAVLAKIGTMLKVVFLSVLVWLSCYALFYSFLFLFDIQPSVMLALTVSVILALAVAAPSGPGFIGVFQTACIAGFVLFGLSKEVATAFSIATHFFHYIIFVSYGIYALSRAGFKLSDLRNQQSAD